MLTISAEQYTDCNVIGSDLSPIQPNLYISSLYLMVLILNFQDPRQLTI
jgi:hypothetical protein